MQARLGILIAGFFLLLTAVLGLSCSFVSNPSGTVVLRLSNESNAHGELPWLANYSLGVNCTGVSVVNCNGAQTELVSLSNESNAHGEIPELTNYTYSVCLNSSSGGSLSCASTSGSVPSGGECVVTLSNESDAHFAACNSSSAYDWKVYCMENVTVLTSCGVISSPGRYVLGNNVSSDGTCFEITASNVTLDLNGYTVSYANVNTGYGVVIQDGVSNVSIQNGMLEQVNASVSSAYGVYGYGWFNSHILDVNLKNLEIITSGWYGYGVYGSYSDSWNLVNVSVFTSDFSAYGVHGSSSTSWNLTNVSVSTSGSEADGVYGHSSSSWSLAGVSVSTSGSGASGVYGYSSNSWNIVNVSVSTISSSAYGLYVISYSSSSGGWRVVDSVVNASSAFDVYLGGDYYPRVDFVNVSFNESDVYFIDADSGILYVGWWVDYYVNDSLGNPLGNVNVSWVHNASTDNPAGISLDGWNITASNGFARRNAVFEYFQNASGKYSFNLYNITAKGYGKEVSQLENITGNMQINLTLDVKTISSCTNITTPGRYVLTQNITSNGTCIRINSSDVTLDLNGNTIFFGALSSSSYGVVLGLGGSSFSNINVQNGYIVQKNTSTCYSAGLLVNRTSSKIILSNLTLQMGSCGTRGITEGSYSSGVLIDNVRIQFSEGASYSYGISLGAGIDWLITNTTVWARDASNFVGVYGQSAESHNLDNITIFVDGSDSTAIYVGSYSSGWNLTRISVSLNGSWNDGIIVDLADNIRINYTSININSSDSTGLYIIYSSPILQFSTIYAANTSSDAFYTNIGGVKLFDSYLFAETGSDIIYSITDSSSIYLVNTTYNASRVAFSSSSQGGNLYRGWWVTYYVNDTLGNPLENVNVSWKPADGTSNPGNVPLNESGLTQADGFLRKQVVYDSFQNASGIYSLNPYTITATLSSISTSLQENITTNMQINITLPVKALTSCGVINESGTYTLNGNVSSNDTCFDIQVSNVTLDCQNNVINYAASNFGYGILLQSNTENISLLNCIVNETNLSQDAIGIYANASSFSNTKVSFVKVENVSVYSGSSAVKGLFTNSYFAFSVFKTFNDYAETIYLFGDVDFSPHNVTFYNVSIYANLLSNSVIADAYVDNVTIDRSYIKEDIRVDTNNRWIIRSTTIQSASGNAIYASRSNNWILSNSTFFTSDVNGDGLYADLSSSWTVQYANITGARYGLVLSSSEGWEVKDSYLSSLRLENDGDPPLLLINTTYDALSYIYGTNPSTFFTGWWTTFFVNDSQGNPLPDVNVSWYYNTSTILPNITLPLLNGSALTDTTGFTQRTVLYDSFTNTSGTFNLNNYTFTARKNSFTTQEYHNITKNEQINITLPLTTFTSCTNITTSGDYLITNNLSSQGSCVWILANNTRLDCAGYTITYATTTPGSAFTIPPNTQNVTLSNCQIEQGGSTTQSPAINLTGMGNGTISGSEDVFNITLENITITTLGEASEGILARAAHEITMRNITITTHGYNAPGILALSSIYWNLTTLTIETLNTSAEALGIGAWLNISPTIHPENWTITRATLISHASPAMSITARYKPFNSSSFVIYYQKSYTLANLTLTDSSLQGNTTAIYGNMTLKHIIITNTSLTASDLVIYTNGNSSTDKGSENDYWNLSLVTLNGRVGIATLKANDWYFTDTTFNTTIPVFFGTESSTSSVIPVWYFDNVTYNASAVIFDNPRAGVICANKTSLGIVHIHNTTSPLEDALLIWRPQNAYGWQCAEGYAMTNTTGDASLTIYPLVHNATGVYTIPVETLILDASKKGYTENVTLVNATQDFTADLLLTPAPASEIHGCQLIDTPGEYTLTRNLTTPYSCIQVNTSNVTLNLMGHSIEYARLGNQYGIYANGDYTNLTILNGSIIQTIPLIYSAVGIHTRGENTYYTNITLTHLTLTTHSENGILWQAVSTQQGRFETSTLSLAAPYTEGVSLLFSSSHTLENLSFLVGKNATGIATSLSSSILANHLTFTVSADGEGIDADQMSVNASSFLLTEPGAKGLVFASTQQPIVTHTTIILNASDTEGISISQTPYLTLTNITMTSTLPNVTGIKAIDSPEGYGAIFFGPPPAPSENASLTNVFINLTGTGSIAIQVNDTNENGTWRINDSTLIAPTSLSLENASALLTNTTASAITLTNTAWSLKGWWVDFYVQDQAGSPVENASITWNTLESLPSIPAAYTQGTAQSLATGYAWKNPVYGLYANTSGTYNLTTRFTAEKNGVEDTQTRSITENTLITFTLPLNVSSCMNITTPGVYALTNNVTSTTTCFRIETSNVTLDCAGHMVTYAQDANADAYGVYIQQDVENISILNCQFNQNKTHDTAYNRIAILADASQASGTSIRTLTIENITSILLGSGDISIQAPSLVNARIQNITITTAGSNQTSQLGLDLGGENITLTGVWANLTTGSSSVLRASEIRKSLLANMILYANDTWRIIELTSGTYPTDDITLENITLIQTGTSPAPPGTAFGDALISTGLTVLNESLTVRNVSITTHTANVISASADPLILENIQINETRTLPDKAILVWLEGSAQEGVHRITNLTLTTNGSYTTCLQLSNSFTNALIENVHCTITSTQTPSAYGDWASLIQHESGDNITIRSSSFATQAPNTSMYNSTSTGSVNITLADVLFTHPTGDYDIVLQGSDTRVYTINTTSNENLIVNQNNTHYKGWHVTFNITTPTGTPVSNALVTWTHNRTATPDTTRVNGSALTNTQGLAHGVLYEYYNTSSTTSLNNYTITVEKNGVTNTTQANITDNSLIHIILPLTPLTTCQAITTPGTYVLQNNVSSDGTCFDIQASNVVLDLNGYSVSYANVNSGYGVVIQGGVENVSIERGVISQENPLSTYSFGVYSNASASNLVSGVILRNTTITTVSNNSYGIYALYASNWTLYNVTLRTKGYLAFGIDGRYSSNFDMNNVSFVTTGPSSSAVYTYSTNTWKLENIFVETFGTQAKAIDVAYSDFWIVSKANITTHNDSSHGIDASSSEGWVLVNSSIRTEGSSSRGILGYADSLNWSLSDIYIETFGSSAYGISSGTYSHFWSMKNVTIITHGSTAYGILGDQSSDWSLDFITIETYGDYGQGIRGTSSLYWSINNTFITTHGSSAHAITGPSFWNVSWTTIKTFGGGSDGIYSSYGWHISNTKIETFNSSSYGIYGSSSTGSLFVENVSISTNGTGAHGIYAYPQTYIVNSTIETNASLARGIYILGSGSILENVYVIVRGDSTYSIYGSSASANTSLENVTLIANGSSSALFVSADGWRLKNSTLQTSSGWDVYMAGTYYPLLYFINVSFNKSRVSFEDLDSGVLCYNNVTTAIVYVNNTTGAPVENATITYHPLSSPLYMCGGTIHTGVDGFSSTLGLFPFALNATGDYALGSLWYFEAYKEGYNASWTTENVTYNGYQVNITLGNSSFYDLWACKNIDSPGRYILRRNVSSGSTCFVIKASNVSLDLSGFEVSFADEQSGFGIVLEGGIQNITIMNGSIVQSNHLLKDSHALFGNGSGQYSNVSNVSLSHLFLRTLANSSKGIHAYYTPSWKLFNLNVSTKGWYSYGIYSSASPYWEIKNVSIATTGPSGIGLFIGYGSDYFYGSNISVETFNESAYGIRGYFADLAELKDVHIVTYGKYGYGINLYASTSWLINQFLVKTYGTSGYGFWVTSNSKNCVIQHGEISGSDAGYTFLSQSGSHNLSLRNITISFDGPSDMGLSLSSLQNVSLLNLTVVGSGDYTRGLYASDVDNVKIENFFLNITGLSTYGIYAGTGSENWSIFNMSLSSSYRGVTLLSFANWSVTNSTISSTSSSDFYLSTSSYPLLNLTNTTFNQSDVYYYDYDSGNTSVWWYVRVGVYNATTLQPLQGVNVTGENALNQIVLNTTTASTGRTAWQPVQAYWEVWPGETNRTNLTPITITASQGSLNATRTIPLTENTYLHLVLPDDQQSPTWRLNGTNETNETPYYNSTILLYALIEDNQALHTVTFSWNATGTWENDTPLVITGNTSYNATFIKTITQPRGTLIAWKLYFNDTAGNMNETTIFTFTVKNAPPSTPVLLTPANNTTNLTSRTPRFAWSESTDPDNDTITYHYQLSLTPDFSSIIIDEPLLSTTNYTPSITLDTDTAYYWRVQASDGITTSPWSEPFTFTITSIVSINITRDLIDFGLLQPGENENTTDNTPLPFSIENTGNVRVNVSVNATPLFTSIPEGTDAYQIKARENTSEANSFNTSLTAWINLSSTIQQFITSLRWEDTNDTALADLNITVPLTESGGNKTSILTFWAVKDE